MTELISLAAAKFRVEFQNVSLNLLQDWVTDGMIDRATYLDLAFWLIGYDEPGLVDFEKVAKDLSTKEMQVFASDVKRGLITLVLPWKIRIPPQDVSLELLQDWLKNEMIDKETYVRLAIWLTAPRQFVLISVKKLAEKFSIKEMQVSVQDVKDAIAYLKQRQICLSEGPWEQ